MGEDVSMEDGRWGFYVSDEERMLKVRITEFQWGC